MLLEASPKPTESKRACKHAKRSLRFLGTVKLEDHRFTHMVSPDLENHARDGRITVLRQLWKLRPARKLRPCSFASQILPLLPLFWAGLGPGRGMSKRLGRTGESQEHSLPSRLNRTLLSPLTHGISTARQRSLQSHYIRPIFGER